MPSGGLKRDIVRIRFCRKDPAIGTVWSSVSLDGYLYEAYKRFLGGDDAATLKSVREIAEELATSDQAEVQAGLSRLVQRSLLKKMFDSFSG